MAVFQPARNFQGVPILGTLLDRLLGPRRTGLASTWSKDAQGRLTRKWENDRN